MEWALTPMALRGVLYLVAASGLQLVLAGLAGWLALRVTGFDLQTEYPLMRWFVRGLVGSLLLPAVYALWMLRGETVAWGLVVGVPLVGWLIKHLGPTGPVLWQPIAQNPIRRLVPVLALSGLLLMLFFPAISVRPAHQPWRILDADNAFYAQCARFMEAGYAENERIHLNALTEKRLPPTPYHYFEMWNAAFVARWSGLPTVMGLQGVHTSQFLILTFLGLVVLTLHLRRLDWVAVAVAAAFCMHQPDFWSELVPAGLRGEIRTLTYYSVLGSFQPKFYHIPPLLIGALLLMGRGYWLAGLTGLVLVPFCSVGGISLVPGLLAFSLVWVWRRVPGFALGLTLGAWGVLGLGYMLFYLWNASGDVADSGFGVLAASGYRDFFYPLQPVNIVGKSTLIVGALVAVPVLAAVGGCWTQVRQLAPLGLLIGLLVLSGLLTWAAAAPALVADAVNFVGYALPLVTLALALLVLLWLERPRRWGLVVLGLWLAAGVLFRVSEHLGYGLRRSYYDPVFVAEAGRQTVTNPIGVWLPDTVGFKQASIFYQNLRIRWPFELVLFPQYLGAEALVDWPQLVDTTTRDGRWLATQSVIFPFAQRLRAQKPDLAFSAIEEAFVRRHRIEWLVVEPRREPPLWLAGRVRRVLTDPRSGTRIYYFRPLTEDESSKAGQAQSPNL